MIIKDTINAMGAGLPNPIPDLLNEDQAALVQSCLIILKEQATKMRWKFIMKHTAVNGTTKGHRTMFEYITEADDNDCMSSVAKDLILFASQMAIG